MSDELRPCPFCGNKPTLLPEFPDVQGNAWGEVACINNKCFAKPLVSDGAKVANERGTKAYQKMAIKRWNRRAGDE